MTDISLEASTAALGKREYNWLDISGKIWFVTTAFGQWLFFIYIIGHFGVRFTTDGVSGFEGTQLANGFIPGDQVGNTALAVHILVGGLIVAAGQIQLIPRIRNKLPRLHRYSGWFYMLASMAVSIAGGGLVWSRERVIGSLIQDIGVTIGGLLVLMFVPLALYYAMNKNFVAHRRWALRLFMVVSAVWFLRLMTFAWFIFGGGVGIDVKTFSGPFLEMANFAQYLLPLALLEIYFLVQKPKYQQYRPAVAGLIIFFSGIMLVGILSISSVWWLPKIGA